MRIGLSEFVEICNVTDRRDFGGFRVEPDGLYTILPDDDVLLFSDEFAALSWHPTGNHNDPALRFPCDLDQLRKFVAEAGLLGCIDEFVLDEILAVMEQDPTSAKSGGVKIGIAKGAVINAFEGLHFNRDEWSKYLASPPAWLFPCRLAKGSKSISATWNPVSIAIALTDPKRGIALNKLDAVFVGLADWADEWRTASDYLR